MRALGMPPLQRAMWDAYKRHRASAKFAGKTFLLTFDDWCSIWLQSGRWSERGIYKYQYCMARHGDKGPYAVGNVSIITNEQNRRDCYHPHYKLTDDDVRAIRHAHATGYKAKRLAGIFGVHVIYLYLILGHRVRKLSDRA